MDTPSAPRRNSVLAAPKTRPLFCLPAILVALFSLLIVGGPGARAQEGTPAATPDVTAAECTVAPRSEDELRALFREAVDGAFGASADEQLLRTIAERGCLTRSVGHEALADELNVSRATYFRRLRQASERLADFIVAKVA